MYNNELKTRFIRDYTQSLNTANVAATVFTAMEPFEKMWQADLCTKTAEELQPAIDKVVALRFRSQWMSLTILKEYVRWCMAMRVPGACDGMFHITAAGLDKVKHQMVSSPFHLQKYLDEVFKEYDKEAMIDTLYRCYYWLAYSGVQNHDVLSVRTLDVDLKEMTIRYGDTSVPIYREALPALRSAVERESFLYRHPHYGDVWRDRVPGNELLRGYRPITNIKFFRSNMSHISAEAIEQHKTELHLSYNRVWMSGHFYRAYENERAGNRVEFEDVVDTIMADKTYTLNGRTKIEHVKKQRARDYMEDYQRWKLAFSI